MLILDLIVLSEFYGVQKFVNNTTKKRASGAKWPVVGILIEFDIAILIYVRLLKNPFWKEIFLCWTYGDQNFSKTRLNIWYKY